MKVLLISEYFYPHWTGIAESFFHLAQQLVQKEHIVSVLTTRFDPTLPQKDEYQKITIVRSRPLIHFSRTYYSLQALHDGFNLIKESDAVIINSPHSNVLPLSLLTRMFGKKLYIFHQGDLILPSQTGNQFIHRTLERLFDMMTVGSFLFSHRISTYTADYARNSRVMRFFMKKFTPYIPPLTISELPPSAPFQKKINTLSKDHILVGFAGRFVEEKGFDILFRAMSLVVRQIKNVHFVFAGKEKMVYEPFFDLHKAVLQKEKKNVTFLGLLDKKDLAYFYKHLAVFVISSRSDCFALTQAEAALSGTPIVCTDIPGARVLVSHTHFGIIVPKENPEKLAEGIVNVIKNQKKITKYQKDVLPFLQQYSQFPFL